MSMPVKNPTHRFSSRVENYVRYRPGYPGGVLELLKQECGLTSGSVVADIASGTGIFTRTLLESGSRVFGVEPNPDMRQAGEEFLKHFPKFTSVAGTAEATTLSSVSVDIVTAAQAAHWFDREKARREFVRILRPGGWEVLIWNERDTDGSPFLREYEQLLANYGTDYQDVRHERTTAEIADFFAPTPFESRIFEMKQEFDYPALEGRLLSSSYTPQPDQPTYRPMLQGLQRMFETHQKNNRVAIEYTTRVYYGQIT
jgi:ubiquinone/menaquinone biosynthesis C-methylase UbiE